jgi:DNA-binding NtrC family response regulator
MGSASPLTGRTILVVEDEPLIALEMTALFESVGATVRQARTVADALRCGDHLSAAVLDYRLGEEDVPALCALLSDRGVPFMFYTGYGDVERTYPAAVVLQKPASAASLLATMASLCAAHASDDHA